MDPTLSFSLIVLLLYPGGEIFRMDVGPGLTREQCEQGRAYAAAQLPGTLVNATVFSIDCVPHRGA